MVSALRRVSTAIVSHRATRGDWITSSRRCCGLLVIGLLCGDPDMGVQFRVKVAHGREAAGSGHFDPESLGPAGTILYSTMRRPLHQHARAAKGKADALRLAIRPRGFAGGDGAHLVPGPLNLGAGSIEIVGGFA